jgi:hypothetical protein
LKETLTAIVEARSAWAQTAEDSDATLDEQIAATQTFDSAFFVARNGRSLPNPHGNRKFQLSKLRLKETKPHRGSSQGF